MIEIDSNSDGILSMILDMRKTYTEYLEQDNETDNQYDKIQIQVLELEQDLYISNKERKQAVTLFQEQIKKLKYYEKIIDNL